MKITNNSAAMQGVHTLRGLVFLKPGEARDHLDLNEGQAKQAGRLKFLDLVGEPSKDTIVEPVAGRSLDIPPNEIDQLRQQTEEKDTEIARLGGLLADREADLAKLRATSGDETPKTPADVLAMANDANVPFMSFKSAAAKVLGDKTPAKKDEIIAALEELATQP
ncbi:hypothetical protein [Shinella sp.]|uniref:hypothetical protein n=1 Tax=Shinella sp. TaxID=1870904 RepID=UPI0028A79F45|nr:hypothetical protein [Shinella sp.]